MKAFCLSALLLTSAFSVYAEQSVSTQVVANKPKVEGVWLDVRGEKEFSAGYLEGAINIPHTQISERIGELNLEKDTPIALYCVSGRRAGIAMEALKAQGFTNVTNHGAFNKLKEQYLVNDEGK